MEKIKIYVTPDELKFIREAINEKIGDLILDFDDSERVFKTLGADTIAKDEPIPVAVHHSMVGKDHAPWGLKKDGTPRARPGRKSVKTRKARA